MAFIIMINYRVILTLITLHINHMYTEHIKNFMEGKSISGIGNPSLAGQPLHKGLPIRELYLLQPGVQPNQIAPRHHQYYGAVPNA
jgi:hypothetical protein